MTSRHIFVDGVFRQNAVYRQILGICSTLAVTNLLSNTLVMSLGLVFVTAMSSLTVSLLRTVTPSRIRMMVQVMIIATYVIVIDLVLQAFLPEISRRLGPYVGLIITNCIIMGRAEAFAAKNPPWPSFLDGVAMGLGYTVVLMSIAVVRELMGFGSLFGITVLPPWFTRWTILTMAPGAFFMVGIVIWVMNTLDPPGRAGQAR
ncbi:NADH:ubiquinone reductase (Na(+)-transporting) subunit D [Candidatus Fermentibacteria bacterium]|nr:NADH:ubiquinone reductase (Na(+)-transporting) subunit D [Candidatus Fermentibacteria bacterium]